MIEAAVGSRVDGAVGSDGTSALETVSMAAGRVSPRPEKVIWSACKLDTVESINAGAPLFLSHCRTNSDSGRLDPLPIPRDANDASWEYVMTLLREMWIAERDGDDAACVKARQMLVSWIGPAGYFLWRLSFRPNYPMFLTSRKEKLVDDGGIHSTPNSLFGRIRHLWGTLPRFLQADIDFSHLRIVNRSNGSYIVGEGASSNLGRSGNYAIAGRDESAFIPQSELCHAALRPAARTIFDWSTPNGPSGEFARVFREKPKSVRLIRLWWWLHPGRAHGWTYDEQNQVVSPWFLKRTERMTRDQIARELQCSFSHSVSGLVWPEFNYDQHVRLRGIPLDPDLDVHVGIDFGIGAATAAVIFQVDAHGKVRVLADYEIENRTARENAAAIWSVIEGLGFNGEPRDVVCHGDPAGNSREMVAGSSVIREYQAFGFTNFTTPRRRQLDGIRLVKRLFHQNRVYISDSCEILPLRIADYQFLTDDAGKVKGDAPVKNNATHICDALRYGMTGVFAVDEEYGAHDTFVVSEAPKERGPAAREERDFFDIDDDSPIVRGNPLLPSGGRRPHMGAM